MTPICRVHRRRRLFTLTFCGMPFSGIEPRRQRPNSRPQPRRERSRGERERERQRERERESRLPPPSALSSCLFLAKLRRRRRRYFVRTSDGCSLTPSLPSSHVPQTQNMLSHATFIAKNELILLSARNTTKKGVTLSLTHATDIVVQIKYQIFDFG